MGPPSSLPLSFQQSELCYFSLSTKTKLDSMASAITCNFPTWCASFHWTLNSERLSPRFFCVRVKCTNSFTSTRVVHLEMFTSRQQECLWRFSFCLCTTSESLKLETPAQCRRSDTEPQLYTSDPYINTSFQAASEETTLEPQHLFSDGRLLSHFSIDPH